MIDVLDLGTPVVCKKRPRQTAPAQIRLKQSDQGLSCYNSDKHYVNSSLDNPILFENRKKKSV